MICSVFPVQFRLNVTFLDRVSPSSATALFCFSCLSQPVNDFQSTSAMSGSGAVAVWCIPAKPPTMVRLVPTGAFGMYHFRIWWFDRRAYGL